MKNGGQSKPLTIFTPTYNREQLLEHLYESLKMQLSHNFLWMIVDDGSIDNTRRRVQGWCEEGVVEIQYLYQENQGKYIAMETAVNACNSPWLICVDSDDHLSPDAVQDMLADMKTALPPECIGYIYPRDMQGDGRAVFPDGVSPVHIVEVKPFYHICETAILFRTEYLKKLQFHRFPGEKFISEEALYIPLTQYGKFVPQNRLFYRSSYRDDGLTRNIFQVWRKSPQGTVFILKLRFAFWGEYGLRVRVRERVKSIMNLNAFCMACHIDICRTTPSRAYSALLYLPSVVWKIIRFS